MVILGLMSSAKLLKSNGIENHIIETLSFDVFHELKTIWMKPNSHGLVWLELCSNDEVMVTHMQATWGWVSGKKTPEPEPAKMLGCSLSIPTLKNSFNGFRLGCGPPNRTVSRELLGGKSRVIQSVNKQRSFGILKQTIVPLLLRHQLGNSSVFISRSQFWHFFPQELQINWQETAEVKHNF